MTSNEAVEKWFNKACEQQALRLTAEAAERQLRKEITLLEASRREIIEIDEERCAEIERLRTEKATLVIENERLRQLLELPR